MRHEDWHALGQWLIAALLGGFALWAWAAGRGQEEVEEPDRTPASAVVTTRLIGLHGG